jgi:lipopolysaccharide transport system ATP-binding protein
VNSDIAIRAERLCKKYVIGHQTERENYTALRDAIVGGARNLARSAVDIVQGRGVVVGDTTEEFWALKDVNFEIIRGEVVGIIGRNGAGKSTLLKILSRITEPSEGRVEIRGRVASLLEVGTGFHAELTGRENIFLNGAILGMTRAEIRQKFDEIVAFAEIEKFLDTPVKRYSTGMYVRLAFAIAAHLEPEILVVDEVLAVGDADFQKKCLGKMRAVAGHGRTVLFVSHNMGAVHQLCQRGLLLHQGHVVLDSTVEASIAQYMETGSATHSIVFPSVDGRPSITKISVNPDRLLSRDLSIDITFVSPWPLRTPVGGIVLRSHSGEPVWGSNARFHKSSVSRDGLVKGTLRCTAQRVPLVAGHYCLSVWLGDWHGDYDSKIDTLRFMLGEADMNGHRPPPSAQGYLDWPAEWRTVDESEKTNQTHLFPPNEEPVSQS